MVAQRPKNSCPKLLTSMLQLKDRSMLTSLMQHLFLSQKRAILLRFAGRDMSLLGLSHSAALRPAGLG